MNKEFPNDRLNGIINLTFENVRRLREDKGREYAGTVVDDALANFRRNAKDVGVEMEIIWRVYAGKHWDSISQYIRDCANKEFNRQRPEPIEGRIDDLITYLCLLKAMVHERKHEEPTPIQDKRYSPNWPQTENLANQRKP
jgi:hypothetical protein